MTAAADYRTTEHACAWPGCPRTNRWSDGMLHFRAPDWAPWCETHAWRYREGTRTRQAIAERQAEALAS